MNNIVQRVKKEIVQFTNRKFAKQAFYNRKKLKSIGKSSLGLNNTNLLINENITPINNKIACICRKQRRNNLISDKYTINGTAHLIIDNIKNGKLVIVLHMKSLIIFFRTLSLMFIYLFIFIYSLFLQLMK